MTTVVAAFYKFVAIEDGPELKSRLGELGCSRGLKGTILIAPEGINVTISARPENMEAFLAALNSDPRFDNLAVKFSTAPKHPFQRFKVKLKSEIITFGVPEANPAVHVGTYVKPQDWNAIISDPDVIVLDTRNSYEVDIGSFERALDPKTSSFSELPAFVEKHLDPKKHKRLAMFCTGGIRCEKASAYLLTKGFLEVYHLEGGILKYLETVPPEQSLWRGECFVFDERVAVEHGVKPGRHVMCPDCGRAIPKTGSVAAPSCPHCIRDNSN